MITGSASRDSSNHRILQHIAKELDSDFDLMLYDRLRELPHFAPEESMENVPAAVQEFRKHVSAAVGVLICTPEYIFSIPSGLKNAFEWSVATTIFTEKPVGIITASAHGVKGHDELNVILSTIQARLSPEASLLIQGVKGKVSRDGRITHAETERQLACFVNGFRDLINGIQARFGQIKKINK